MFKTVRQCSFLEYKESFQNQLKQRKTSLPTHPLTPHDLRGKKAGYERQWSADSSCEAMEKMVATSDRSQVTD